MMREGFAVRLGLCTLLLAALLIAAGSTAADTVYSSRAAFEAAFTGLSSEDFEEGQLGNIAGPLNASTNNEIFAAGEIAAGVSFDATPGGGTLVGDLFIMNSDYEPTWPSNTLMTSYGTDALRMTFSTPVTEVGFDVYSYFNASSVVVTLSGSSGVISSTTVNTVASGTPVFFGFSAGQNITSVTLADPDDSFVGVDNLLFGSAAPAANPVPLPAAAWAGLALMGGLGVRKLHRGALSQQSGNRDNRDR